MNIKNLKTAISIIEIMGGKSSTHDENKTVDATGVVNNNLILNEKINIYSVELVVLMSIICVLKAIKLGLTIYLSMKRNIKKTYANRQNPV